MSLCFLGTGSGIPSRSRSTSATLLCLGGSSFLFDAGEGVQRQLQFLRGTHKLSKIERIFITHLHGDHIFGLPGLILGLQDKARSQMLHVKSKKKNQHHGTNHCRPQENDDDHENNNHNDAMDTVKIYGPPGLYHFIASSLMMSCTKLYCLRVQVFELVGGRVKRISSPWNHPHSTIKNPFYDDYPEYQYAGLLDRQRIPCQNGIWTIEETPPPLTRDLIVYHKSRRRRDRLEIRAAEVDHLSGIATFGFVIQEPEPAGNIDAIKAKALGVSFHDNKYELLKYGFPVKTDDGSGREVHPSEVLKPQTKKARKVTIVGDNRKWTKKMTEIAKNSDVLVHEATLVEEDYQRGHSTAEMAGRQSEESNARLLILNHISPKCDQDLKGMVKEAYEGSKQKSSVLASFDFMEIEVPWMGFEDLNTAVDPLIEKDSNDLVKRDAATRLVTWAKQLIG